MRLFMLQNSFSSTSTDSDSIHAIDRVVQGRESILDDPKLCGLLVGGLLGAGAGLISLICLEDKEMGAISFPILSIGGLFFGHLGGAAVERCKSGTWPHPYECFNKCGCCNKHNNSNSDELLMVPEDLGSNLGH